MKSLTNEQILDQMPAQLFPTYIKEFIRFGRAIEALCNSKKRKPLTDKEKYALIQKHLGLEKRRDNTVIDRQTGRFTDAQRYIDLIDEAANGIKDET
jgi:hypothetical protein